MVASSRIIGLSDHATVARATGTGEQDSGLVQESYHDVNIWYFHEKLREQDGNRIELHVGTEGFTWRCRACLWTSMAANTSGSETSDDD
jgi:hypothetical protein